MFYFIKKIFQNKDDERVHSQFVRFSRGIFENRAVMNISRNGKIKISGTFELSSDLARFMAFLGKKINVSGILMSREEIAGLSGSMKKGVFVYEINEAVSFERLEEISKKAYCLLLDCDGEGITLKTKKTVPKPSPKGLDKVNDRFCVAQIDIKFWSLVKSEFLFDLPEGKKYRIINKYEITEIIVPENEKDSEKLRLLAKRKGKVVRKSIVDGNETVQEKNFIA